MNMIDHSKERDRYSPASDREALERYQAAGPSFDDDPYLVECVNTVKHQDDNEEDSR